MSHYLVDNSLAGVLKEVERQLEVAVAPIIGVGDIWTSLVTNEILVDAMYLDHIIGHSAETFDVIIILIIHHDDKVKFLKVGRSDLTCTTIEIISPQHAMMPHTTVWQVTDMPTANACRVNIEIILKTLVLHHGFQDALGCRRTAYITKAHK